MMEATTCIPEATPHWLLRLRPGDGGSLGLGYEAFWKADARESCAQPWLMMVADKLLKIIFAYCYCYILLVLLLLLLLLLFLMTRMIDILQDIPSRLGCLCSPGPCYRDEVWQLSDHAIWPQVTKKLAKCSGSLAEVAGCWGKRWLDDAGCGSFQESNN